MARLLKGGDRLHLQHGPIDLIIGAEGDAPTDRDRAFAAAHDRIQGLLEGLVSELELHRSQLFPDTPQPLDPVAQHMHKAARRFCEETFLTPMIAVAGSVADTILAAMVAAQPLRRAYVNNGGDIALHLEDDAQFSIAMAQQDGADLGRISISAGDDIGGIASSGAPGRSFSLGIADSVTVLAKDAATADVAATLIANAIDLPDHPGIKRTPATELQPDNDLGDRPVTTFVPDLSADDCRAALASGRLTAERFLGLQLIQGASLTLQGYSELVGARRNSFSIPKEPAYA